MAQLDTFNLPDDLYYQTEDHLWVRVEANLARIGLDDVALASAQVVTHLRLKPPGRPIPQGRPFGTMEAGKYVGPLRLPVSGKVIEINQDLLDNPSLAPLSSDPYNAGWLALVEPDNLQGDLVNLAHGAAVQPWLEKSVTDWRARGLLKK